MTPRSSSLSPVTYPSAVDLWPVAALLGSALATFAVTCRRGRPLLISPRDQQRFLADIRSRR